METSKKAQTEARPTISSVSPVLRWEVFVTPGIPIRTADRPAGLTETFFQAMASTLIYGEMDAVLVDTFMTAKQANDLADWVEAKGKNLITIYITHGHGDHWFGAGTLLERFPKARLVATPSSVEIMKVNASPKVLDGAWKAGFSGQIPDNLVIADALNGNVIDLEGKELVVVELGHTDTDYTTCLHVPSIGLVSPATPPTTTSTFISPSRMNRRGRNGSLHSTRSRRLNHALLWRHISGPKTK